MLAKKIELVRDCHVIKSSNPNPTHNFGSSRSSVVNLKPFTGQTEVG